METTELMINDWVLHDGTPKQVNVIWGNRQVSLCDPSKTWGSIYADKYDAISISPLVLTPEILEKNGFEVQDQGGGRKDVWAGFGIDCEGDIEVEFQNNIPVHLKIDGGFKGEYHTSANIKYVHELQHALKLCGIEKEIEL